MKGTIDTSLFQIEGENVVVVIISLMEPVTGGGNYAVGGDSTNPSALWFSQLQSTILLPGKLQHILLEWDTKHFHLHAIGIHGCSILFVKHSLTLLSQSFPCLRAAAGAQLCW